MHNICLCMRFVCLNLLCVSNVVCVFARVGNHETIESSSSVVSAYFPAKDAMGAAGPRTNSTKTF